MALVRNRQSAIRNPQSLTIPITPLISREEPTAIVVLVALAGTVAVVVVVVSFAVPLVTTWIVAVVVARVFAPFLEPVTNADVERREGAPVAPLWVAVAAVVHVRRITAVAPHVAPVALRVAVREALTE